MTHQARWHPVGAGLFAVCAVIGAVLGFVVSALLIWWG